MPNATNMAPRNAYAPCDFILLATPRRTAATTGGGGIVAAIRGVARGPHRPSLRHTAVDAQAGAPVDRTRIRRSIQRSPRVALARTTGLFQPEARPPRLGARRGRDRTLAQAHLAGAKKNAARQGRLIVFIDESGVSERPTRVNTRALRGGETPIGTSRRVPQSAAGSLSAAAADHLGQLQAASQHPGP